MAYCEYCGQNLSDLAFACPKCGHPRGRVSSGAVVASPVDGTAKTAKILGIIGLVAWLLPIIGLPVTITGVVLAQKANRLLPGVARSALTMNWVGLGLSAANALLGVVASV